MNKQQTIDSLAKLHDYLWDNQPEIEEEFGYVLTMAQKHLMDKAPQFSTAQLDMMDKHNKKVK